MLNNPSRVHEKAVKVLYGVDNYMILINGTSTPTYTHAYMLYRFRGGWHLTKFLWLVGIIIIIITFIICNEYRWM